MHEHRIGTREEWQVARNELAKLEAEQAKRNEEITNARRDLPWVRVEKEYEFDTQDAKNTLGDLFARRDQRLPSTSRSGPAYRPAPCPGRRGLPDGSDA